MTDSERAAWAVANYLAKLRPLIEARTPLPWRPDERDPQRVVQAAKAVVGPLRKAFQLFGKYRGAGRVELLEARRQQRLNHLPVRRSPVKAFGITRMFYLDIACKIIEAAVENVELIAEVADSPESQSHDDLVLHLADRLPDISGKKGERFLAFLEVEARDAAGKAQAGGGKTTTKRRGGGRTKDQAVQVRNKKIVADFKRELDVDAITDRYGISAPLARKIKSESEKAAKNRQS